MRRGLAVALLMLACCRQGDRASPRAVEPTGAARRPATPTRGVEAHRSVPSTAGARPPTAPLTPAITDPLVLAELEQHGLGLAELMGGAAAQSNAALYAASQRYRELVAFTREDIAASITEENRYRPDWGAVGTTLHAKRRNLDPRWLSAENASYELAGIVNRMDRAAPFNAGTCGELRLIYRLAYRAQKIASRLPFTVNVVFLLDRGDTPCGELVTRWRLPATPTAEWLQTQGPLRADALSHLKSIETNYQVIRSASGIRNQMGGSAEYVLRVFHDESGHLVRSTLENTPDVPRLAANAPLRAELLAFLRDEQTLRAVDRGTLLLPERFLATRVSSFAPHGLARMENRLFDAVFDPADFAGLDLAQRRQVRSPTALLRRLDDLTCVGCHQARTIAGFHFLGEDRSGTHPLNEVFFAGSGHFRIDLVRRLAYLERLERGEDPIDERPFSFAPTGDRASYGDLCSLPGAQAFEAWACEDGLTCQTIDPAVGETALGQCFPEERRAGDPCLRNVVLQNHHSLDKMVMPWTQLGCAAGYACRMPGKGFPNGMCTSACDAISSPGEICGPTAGSGFADCLAGSSTFDRCLERHRELASRGRCNATRSCRNDYVCARTSDGADGACVPAYFLFQLRVDGHPLPR